jgi:hypothetical protein
LAKVLAEDVDKNGNRSKRKTLLQVANWADEIRSTDANEPRWHYDKLVLCKAPPLPKDGAFCDKECASAQIKAKMRILSDSSNELRDRNEALKWIVHLVGDVHQPLHAASNVYDSGVLDSEFSKDDRGGNHVPVVITGYSSRGRLVLHKAWDNAFVDIALKLNGHASIPPATLAALAKDAEKLSVSIVSTPVSDWVLESHRLAKTVAYDFDDFACREPVDADVTLSAEYRQRAASVVRERVVIAGARLAHLLNSALDPGN